MAEGIPVPGVGAPPPLSSSRGEEALFFLRKTYYMLLILKCNASHTSLEHLFATIILPISEQELWAIRVEVYRMVIDLRICGMV